MKNRMNFTCFLVFLGISLFIVPSLKSQTYTELWGMTQSGGENGIGCIFKTEGSGNNEEVVFKYGENPMRAPQYTHLCQASNGKLYGMTTYGGSSDMGVLFEYDPTTSTYTKKNDFAGTTNGSNPRGSLMQASNGKLYGMTQGGGSNGMGVLFEYDPATSTYTKKLDFAGTTNGSYPSGSLMQASNGKLYGMTRSGGSSNLGVLFEYDPATSTYTKKIDFAGTTNGSNPYGSLMQAANGKLYGMTTGGGSSNMGILFEYDPASSTYTKKIDFTGTTNGSYPYGSLMQAANGKLYGMTYQGGSSNYGVLFEYDPATSTYTKKLDFAGTTNGSYPLGSLMQASNGKLYGMTSNGGSSNYGVLFEYDPATSTYTKKLDFAGAANGSSPQGSQMQASNGKLYGMTSQGGSSNLGVLFEYDPATSTYTKKLDFAGTTNGSYPYGSLMQTSNGKLYGLTSQGGSSGMGVLFEYDPATSTYTKKIDFTGATNGSYPSGSLMQAANGKLYGMTNAGGSSGMGVLFEYDPATSTYTKKIDFTGTTNGSYPRGSLMQASNGKLYGMTTGGGSSNMGILFEYDPASSTYTKKIDFTGTTNGSYPYGSLMQAANGKLYGMTSNGGSSFVGVLFEYDPTTSTYTKKIDFTGATNGSYPFGSLMQASNGKLYGMTNAGGSSGMGVLFEYDPATSTYTKKIDFTGATNGSHPNGSLMQAANGKLYGMTQHGGSSDMGVLFEYDPLTSTYTKKLDFDGSNGKAPYYTHLIEICAVPEIIIQPINARLCPSNNTMFAVNAVGNNLSYQWQVNEGSGFYDLSNNSIYANVTDDTLLANGVSSSMNNYQYRCVVTSTCPAMSIISDTVILTVHPTYAFTENHSICDNESYTWHGTTYTAAGTYTASYNNVNGCDSVYTLNLSVNPTYAFTENHSICDNESYTWHGTTYTAAGTYTASYNNVNGCDSVYTLNLSVNPTYAFTENHSICDNESYTWHGTTYTAAGPYTASYNTVNGCDSVYTLNLNVNPTYATLDEAEICSGELYHWHGNDYSSAGTYYDSLLTVNGCDSVYILNLTVNPTYLSPASAAICDGDYYSWRGSDYYNSGTYYDSLQTLLGCDSVYMLNLTVNSNYLELTETQLCEGETVLWRGTEYSTTGVYYDSLLTVASCDSVFELDLIVHPLELVGIVGLDNFFCADDLAVIISGDPVGGVFSGQGISGNTFDPTTAGVGLWPIVYTYTDGYGCVNADTIDVTVDACAGLSESDNSGIVVFPNPTSGQLNIAFQNEDEYKLSLIDALGQIIQNKVIAGQKVVQIDLGSVAPGVYMLKIENAEGFVQKRVVVER